MNRSKPDQHLVGALPIIGLGALAILLQAFPSLGERATLIIDPIGPKGVYQIITCHFDHWSWNHLLWSGGAFVLTGLVAWRLSNTRTVLGLIIMSCLCVGMGVLVIRPDLSAYNGLSGIDCALFAFVAVRLLKRAWYEKDYWTMAFGLLALIGLPVKIDIEMQGHHFFVSTPGMVVVPEAHLLGMVSGLLFGIWHAFKRCAKPSPNSQRVKTTILLTQ